MITLISCLVLCAILGIVMGYIGNKLDQHFGRSDEDQ